MDDVPVGWQERGEEDDGSQTRGSGRRRNAMTHSGAAITGPSFQEETILSKHLDASTAHNGDDCRSSPALEVKHKCPTEAQAVV